MTERNEDRNLAPEQFEEMNLEFYDADFGPADYLSHRLRALLLVTSNSEQVDQALREPFDVGGTRITLSEDEMQPGPGPHGSYLAAESTVVLHHAAEALVRLYMAHRRWDRDPTRLPPCPWLEAARQRHPLFKFNKELLRLQRSLEEPSTAASLMEVFIGTEERPSGYDGQIDQPAWDDYQRALVALFQVVVARLLSDAGLYNAAKHGLAIIPGESWLSGAFEDEPEPTYRFLGDGPAVTYLDRGGEKGAERWERRVTWVRPEGNLQLILLITRQVENLWTFARSRYLKVGPKGGQPFRVHLMELEEVHRALTPKPQPGVIRLGSSSRSLLYRLEDRG